MPPSSFSLLPDPRASAFKSADICVQTKAASSRRTPQTLSLQQNIKDDSGDPPSSLSPLPSAFFLDFLT
jgi:hypothetical protein